MSRGGKRKPLLSEAERAKFNKTRAEQNHTCPLCGEYAEPSFTRVMCTTIICRNYDSRIKKPAPEQLSFDDETEKWTADAWRNAFGNRGWGP